jgi:hypothetical protein
VAIGVVEQFRVRFLEVSSLEAYLTVSVQKNNIESREQQVRQRMLMPTFTRVGLHVTFLR